MKSLHFGAATQAAPGGRADCRVAQGHRPSCWRPGRHLRMSARRVDGTPSGGGAAIAAEVTLGRPGPSGPGDGSLQPPQ
eukprot:CAMPEP_0115830660 /NCGR_PEP_ID=MMETSP0287-20121206/1730_1 /TAXON_ID=412157 /ORGANISM="Chrysochromulina rotalis, Strain UIO044" /LENGTH=78 /DNA_ID=CAMNT_0003283967 /DNA_START=109 /DNA_END=345 /DNA_ORIENTATION=+